MRVRARNFCGLASADLALSGITLVGGDNAAGKSSLIEGIAAAALREAQARGGTKKADLAALVRDGAEAGSVTLDWDTGSTRVSWPSGEVAEKGDGAAVGTALGIGYQRLSEVPIKQRGAIIAERLKLEPTLLDLQAWFAALDEDERPGDDAVKALWERIDASGWDAVHAKAAEASTKLTGRWEQASGMRWGSKRAATWRPEMLHPDEDYTPEETDGQMKAARAKLDQLLQAGAVTEAMLDKARADAADLTASETEVTGCRASLNAKEQALQRLEKKRDKLEPLPAVEQKMDLVCPHCEKPVNLRRNADSKLYLSAPIEQMSEADLAKLRAEHASIEEAIRNARDNVTVATASLDAALRRSQKASEAATQLAELEARPSVSAAEIAAAQATLAEAEARAAAVKSWLAARAVYADWKATQPMLAALAPNGVRAKKVKDGIDAWRRELADLSETAQWAPVSVTDDLEITFGGRAWRLLAESEKWRADLLLTLSLAKREGSRLVLADRLDVLHPRHRPGVFLALKSVGIAALVTGTVSAPENMPSLAKAGFGQCFWIENGTTRPLD